MAEIIRLHKYTEGDIDPREMMDAIFEGGQKNVFVIAWPADGGLPSYHSSTGDLPVVLMRLQEFAHKYFNREFELDEGDA